MDLDDTTPTGPTPDRRGRPARAEHSGSRWEPVPHDPEPATTEAPGPRPTSPAAASPRGPRHSAPARPPRRRRVLVVTSLAGAVALAGAGVAIAADQGGPNGGAAVPAATTTAPETATDAGRGADGPGRRAAVNRPARPQDGDAPRRPPITDGLLG